MLTIKRPKIKKINIDKELLTIAAAALIIFFAFFWHLGTLTLGMSPSESATKVHAANIHTIYSDPTNGPYYALTHFAEKLGFSNVFSLRFISAIIALIFIYCFYRLAVMWFGKFIALLSSTTLLTTPLVILSARSATPDVLYLLPLAVIATYYWFVRNDNPRLIPYLLLIILGSISLYTPGLIWLLAAGIFLIRKQIKNIYSSFSLPINIGAVVVGLLILAPLAIAIVDRPGIAKNLLLVPDKVSFGTLKEVVWGFLGLGWKTVRHNQMQIDNLPLLNAAQIVLSLFGVYALWSRARIKTYALVSTIAISLILIGLVGQYSLYLLAITPISILTAAGLRYLYIEWQGVFPVNPIPRGLALILMGLLTMATIGYGFRYSLVAWPHTVATKSVYVIK